MNDSESEEEEAYKPGPKKAGGAPKKVAPKKAAVKKAEPKKPEVFKAGKWNPDTELIEGEVEKCGESKMPDYSCCKVCNMRNLHRAVNKGDPAFLKKLVLDTWNVPHILSGWSSDDIETILSKIVVKDDLKLLEALYPTQGWTSKKQLG